MPYWLVKILPWSSYYKASYDEWDKKWGKKLDSELASEMAWLRFSGSPLGKTLNSIKVALWLLVLMQAYPYVQSFMHSL